MKNVQFCFQLKTLMLLTALSLSSSQTVHAAAPMAVLVEHEDHSIHAGHSGHDHTRPDSHAPIGVAGDHLMREGEIMLSYRYMSMDMDGNRTGTDRVDTPLAGYMVSPLSMDMEMHMLGAMYAPSDKLTLMLMVPYTSISMDHRVNMNSKEFTTESSGIGDVKLAATYGLIARPGSDFLFNFAINAPTGSIDEMDNTTGTKEVHLPYPMQLGSGTWDFTPGLTYVQTYDNWSWGAQGLYTFRTGTNDNGYTLGDKFEATTWAAKQVANSASISFRLKALDWGNIDGSDEKQKLPLMAVPTVDPNLRGGTRVDALVGINFVPPGLTSLRLAAEVGAPVYQKLDGPQLETDLVFTLGAQYTF
jgi:hypothetical protein